MKKLIWLLVLPLILAGCLRKPQSGKLTVTAEPNAKVVIDGQEVGQTPYENNKLPAGEITLELIPEDGQLQPWKSLVMIKAGVETRVWQKLASEEAQRAGYILSLEKNNQSSGALIVISQPEGAMLKIDGKAEGPTPFNTPDIQEGNHTIEITSPGYDPLVIGISTHAGYKTTINAKLARKKVDLVIEDQDESSASAEASGSPTPAKTTPAAKATAKPTQASAKLERPYVKVIETPTGWLRVREKPTVNSAEITKINPGETYKLLDEQSGWYKIQLDDEQTGWISGTYAKKYE